MKLKKRSALPLYDNGPAVDPTFDLTLPLESVNSGRELGIRAHHFKVKSVEGILEVARCVNKAYDMWYVPNRSRGKPKRLTPERMKMQQNWDDFLAHSGWEMPRHAKVLRNYWLIGRRAHLLEPNSAKLPNSLEALAVIADDTLADEHISKMASELPADATIRDAKKAVSTLKRVPTQPIDSAAPAASEIDEHASTPPTKRSPDALPYLRLDIPNQEENIVAMAAVIVTGDLLKLPPPDSALYNAYAGKLRSMVDVLWCSAEFTAVGVLLERLGNDAYNDSIMMGLESLKERRLTTMLEKAGA